MATKSKGTGDVVTDDKTVLLPEITTPETFLSHGEMDRHDPQAGPVLHTEERQGITAKEYRAKGYNISDKYADDDIVYSVEADGYGDPHHVVLVDGSILPSAVHGEVKIEPVAPGTPPTFEVSTPEPAKTEPVAPLEVKTEPVAKPES